MSSLKWMFDNFSVRDVLKMTGATLIASGEYRDVYFMREFPGFVLKHERILREGFCNAVEWRNWHDHCYDSKIGPWLAPVHYISPQSSLLLMSWVDQDPSREYPRQIPSVFTDLKRSNFGWIDDRFVCCDYAALRSFDGGMRYARWHGKIINNSHIWQSQVTSA